MKMPERFLATTVLAAALLFSQGGNLVIAALCPHLQSGIASCETKPAVDSLSHADMGHEGMDHVVTQPESSSQPATNAFVLDQPFDSCSHCVVHSGTTRNPASLSQTEAARRSVDFSIPPQASRLDPVAVSPIAVFPSRAHGPPGPTTPRHILINIFRI